MNDLVINLIERKSQKDVKILLKKAKKIHTLK